jgi:hypothetical protein
MVGAAAGGGGAACGTMIVVDGCAAAARVIASNAAPAKSILPMIIPPKYGPLNNDRGALRFPE